MVDPGTLISPNDSGVSLAGLPRAYTGSTTPTTSVLTAMGVVFGHIVVNLLLCHTTPLLLPFLLLLLHHYYTTTLIPSQLPVNWHYEHSSGGGD